MFAYKKLWVDHCECNTKTIELDLYKIKLNLWDTIGIYKYQNIIKLYARWSSAILLFCDLSKSIDESNLGYWNDQIDINKEEYTIICLIGSKSDIKLS